MLVTLEFDWSVLCSGGTFDLMSIGKNALKLIFPKPSTVEPSMCLLAPYCSCPFVIIGF